MCYMVRFSDLDVMFKKIQEAKSMKSYLALLGLNIVIFIGCTTSGVIPMGPDTYSVSTTNELSPALAKKQAIEAAAKHCQSLGKQAMPVQTQQGSHVDAFGDNLATYDYMFRCLSPGDKDLGRPEIKDPALKLSIDQKIEEKKDIQTKSNSSGSDLYIELKKLQQLKDDGIITEQEFQELKRKTIERY